MEEKLYTIGETAQLMGVSVQALRKYSNLGLVVPEYVNESTNYRYYSFSQFHLIDKIKYFRDLGIPLPEIQRAFATADSANLAEILREHQQKLEAQIQQLQATIDNLSWYIDYFSYSKQHAGYKVPYILRFPKRYALYVPFSSYHQAETQLFKLRGSPQGQQLGYLRQYGYVVDPVKLGQGQFAPLHQFMFLKEPPQQPQPPIQGQIMEFPAGEYLCLFSGKQLENGAALPPAPVGRPGGALVLAVEYENNRHEYGSNLPCEFEFYMG